MTKKKDTEGPATTGNKRSSELGVVRESAVAVPNDAAYEMPWDDDVEQTAPDKIPFIKIAYGGSRGKPDDIKLGQMFNSVTGEVLDSFTGVLIHAKLGQSMFPSKFSKDNVPLCSSDDGVIPNGRGDEPQPGPCRRRINGALKDSCPKMLWTGPRTDRVPPPCATKYTLLFWNMSTQSPCMITLSKGEVDEFKSLKLAIKQSRADVMQAHDNPVGIAPSVLMPVEVTTKIVPHPSGDYYPFVLRMTGDKVDLGEARELMSLMGQLQAAVKALDVNADNAEEVADDGPGSGSAADLENSPF